MPDRLGPIHQAAFGEVFDDHRIRLLDEDAGEGLDLGAKAPLEIDDMPNRDPLLEGEVEVVNAVSSRGVNDPGAVLD